MPGTIGEAADGLCPAWDDGLVVRAAPTGRTHRSTGRMVGVATTVMSVVEESSRT
jgi:hypothetical protein